MWTIDRRDRRREDVTCFVVLVTVQSELSMLLQSLLQHLATL
jgi:hypothetical protein